MIVIATAGCSAHVPNGCAVGDGYIPAALNPDIDDLQQELQQFGKRLIPVLYSPEAIAIRRLAIAELGHSGIGKVVFERSMVPIENHVA